MSATESNKLVCVCVCVFVCPIFGEITRMVSAPGTDASWLREFETWFPGRAVTNRRLRRIENVFGSSKNRVFYTFLQKLEPARLRALHWPEPR